VVLPDPMPGVITGDPSGDFRQKTHAIEYILKAGSSRNRPKPDDKSLLNRLFPQFAQNDALWDFPTDLESIIAQDIGGVHLGGGDHFQDFGLNLVGIHPPTPFDDKDFVIFTMTRVLNRIINREAEAEVFIERYRKIYADLTAELQPETLPNHPHTLALVSPSNDWSRVYGWGQFDPRLALIDATAGYNATGRESDAERILAMNPDLIIIFVGDYAGITHDPRWQGLDAVRHNRIYENIPSNRYALDLDGQPLGSRWIAELAYPDRLQPKLRELMFTHYRDSYGYRLNDDEIDEQLNVQGNRHALGYARFLHSPPEPTP
jgi:hypothetical protein